MSGIPFFYLKIDLSPSDPPESKAHGKKILCSITRTLDPCPPAGWLESLNPLECTNLLPKWMVFVYDREDSYVYPLPHGRGG